VLFSETNCLSQPAAYLSCVKIVGLMLLAECQTAIATTG